MTGIVSNGDKQEIEDGWKYIFFVLLKIEGSTM
jgi:hypothetical protein